MAKQNNLNDDIDYLIGKKLQEKLEEEISEAEKVKKYQVLLDFSKVPETLIFSNKAIYLLFNRITKVKSFITGEQAEALIGLCHDIKKKLCAKSCDNFTISDYFVKFHQIKLEIKE